MVNKHYKIVKENGSVSFQSFNLYGGNQWGRKLKFPTGIDLFYIKKNVMGTAILFTDQGWQPSFRIHSGDGLAKPALKFAVSLIGNRNNLSRHEIDFS